MGEPRCSECGGQPFSAVGELCIECWRKFYLTGPVADPVYLAPIPEGIRVNCGDLHRVKEMTPKAMRGFALRLLEMAEGRE